jgi:hypothetical protein
LYFPNLVGIKAWLSYVVLLHFLQLLCASS